MDPNNVNDRLQQDNRGGSPKLHPDEQRRYLGTFRERVSLAIPANGVKNPEALRALKMDMERHPDYHLIINTNLVGSDVLARYMDIADKYKVQFTMIADPFYNNYSYGIIFASDKAINTFPILWNKKYE